jgi:hypothetical protein
MKVFTVKIAVVLFLVLGYYSGSAQTITVSASNNGLTTTAVGGASDIGIFGFEVARGSGSGGITTKVQSFKIKLSKDPGGIFDTPRIFLSANNSFGGDVSIGTMTLSNPSADNYYYELTLEAADEITLAQSSSLFFFLVVNVDPDVIPADGPINAFIEADGDIVVSSAAGNTGTPAGPNINFTQLTTTIGSLNAPANNVAASPLTASSSGQAVFGFSLQSNGTQTLTALAIQFTETPIGKYSDYTLVPSNDADFSTPNSTPIAGLTFTPSASQVTITGLNESITSTTKYFFLVVNVDGGVTAATDPIQASLSSSNLTITGYASGSATGVDYSFIGLTTTLEQITGGIATSPLASNSTENAILGFSIVSNGNPNLTALTIELTSNANGKFTNVKLYESANNTFGGDSEIVDPGGYTVVLTNSVPFRIQFTNLAQELSSTPRYYFVVADVTPTVNASTPTIQPSFNVSNVAVSGGGDVIVTDAPVTGTEYSFVDNSPPTISSTDPTDNATNVSVKLIQLTITFNEPVVHIGDNSDANNMVRIRDVAAAAYIDTILVTDINVAGNIVTLLTDAPFEANKNYAIRIGNSVFEDASSNPFAGISDNTTWNFQTENTPNISSLSNTTRCIGDALTINGSRFTGSGGTGNTKPTVTINGNVVHPDSIKSFTSTTITLNIPANASSGNVVVVNNDSELTSNGLAITIHPQINTGLTVTPATLNPAQNTNVNITVASTQSSSYNYALILTDAPGAYSVTPPSTVHSLNGNDGTRVLNTSDGGTPNLNVIGDYTYRIDVARTGCTTRTLNNTPFTLTVASLSVSASATNTSICEGSSAILIAQTSGGTGFYQFAWTGPNGFSSNSSSPTITPSHPEGTGWYVITLTDNSTNTDKDSIYITTFPAITVSIDPAPGETVVRTEYTVENNDYRLYGSPSGGAFTGQGVTLKNDGNYYFNPQNAGVGTWTITYTYNDVSGCTDQDTKSFRVSNTVVNGLDLAYCVSTNSDSPLAYNPATFPSGYQFTRLVFIRYSYALGNYCIAESAPTWTFCASFNPLTVNSTQSVPDIQAGVTLPVGTTLNQPVSYTIDIAGIRNNYGYSYNGVPGTGFAFYILVYGKDNLGNERYLNAQFFRVVENGPAPSIVGINEMENVCADADPIILSSSEPGYGVTGFSIPSPYSSSLSGTNNNTFDPGHTSLVTNGLNETILTVTLSYTDFNNCPNTVNRNFNWVKKPSAPFAADTAYCQITSGGIGKFVIEASPNGPATNPYWYEVDPSSGSAPILDSVNFVFTAPGITGETPIIKNFYVTQGYKGCEGNATVTSIEIKQAPNAIFTVPPICEAKDFTLTGPLDSGTPYSEYLWTFGDGQSDTVLNDNLVTYNYGDKGNIQFNIGLTVTNNRNCTNSSFAQATVGQNPVPNFTTQLICEGDDTQFIGSTNISGAAQFEWDFGDSSPVIGPGNHDSLAPEGGTFKEPVHQFSNGAGVYNVTITSYTPLGCFSSLTKPVRILHYLTHTSEDPYLMEALDGGQGFWRLEDVSANSTWEFATPSTPNMTAFNSPAWVTKADSVYRDNEKSFINSPCIDFSDISRPVISIDYISNLIERLDGAVLEYSKDGGLNWEPLGDIGTGLEWFNTTGFLLGNIGSSSRGWSGNLLDESTTPAGLKTGKHRLDDFDNPVKGRFRLAFASGGGDKTGFEGFAFRNVSIQSRNRNLLAENFTQGGAAFAGNNTNFANIPDDEAVKIQYHLPFPDTGDNIYLQNTVDPGARMAFYGISNSTPSVVPRAYIDGYSQGSYTSGWDYNYRVLRSLVASPLELTINTVAPSQTDQLEFTITINPLQDIDGENRKPVLHAVVIEGNIVRKFLPHAAGQALSYPILATDSPTEVPFIWRPDNNNFVKSEIAIVAFVQDEITKEVYQAAALLNPDPTHVPDPSIITGLEDPAFASKIVVYPNPASDEVHVVLPAPVVSGAPIQLMDAQGRIVYEGSFNAGEQRKTIATATFAGGIYLLHIRTKENVAVKKVMVAHQGN